MTLIIGAAQSLSFAGDVSKNVSHHLDIARLAAKHGVQLLVFPELSLTGYEPLLAAECAINIADPRLEPLKRFAREAQMAIVVGAPTRGESGQLHIGAFTFLPDGTALTYTKKHLHDSEEKFFTNGPGGSNFALAGETVSLAICADISHPEHAESAAASGATIYAAGVLISEKGYAPDAALMQRYAATHHLTVLMANHAGPTGGWLPAGKSAIWSSSGAAVATAETAETLVLADLERGVVTGGAVIPFPPN